MNTIPQPHASIPSRTDDHKSELYHSNAFDTFLHNALKSNLVLFLYFVFWICSFGSRQSNSFVLLKFASTEKEKTRSYLFVAMPRWDY